MNAIIYIDFFLAKLMVDVRKWYDKNYYPKGYKGNKAEAVYHIELLRSNYDYDSIKGNNIAEKRINYLSDIQDIMNRINFN